MTSVPRIQDKTLLLKTHPCVRGLSDDVVREIADAAELMRCDPGASIHRANEVVTSIYLVLHGRVSTTLTDPHGNIIVQRFLTVGGQFGGLAAAMGEPAPIECTAEDPTTLLRIDYDKVVALTGKHPAFRMNLTRAMAETVKHTLMNHRQPVRPPLVAICHQTAETRVIGRRLYERLAALGDELGILTDRADWQPVEGTQHRCIADGDRMIAPEALRRQMNEWLATHRVFADFETGFDPTLTRVALEVCENVLWCVTPRTYEASVGMLRDIQTRAPGLRDKITLVWLLDRGQQAPLAPELRQLARRDVKISFDEPAENESRVLADGLERLVHQMRGIRIGLALGGGAARGMAHLGVLKVLERSGIVVDMISGTSAGAMTGTVYAAGMGADHAAEQFALALRPSWFFRHIPSGDQWHLLYKYRRGQFDPMLRRYIADVHFEQLAVPMSAVTLDLIGGREVVRDTGDAVHGIIESINLPGLSPPVNRAGQALIDGGLVNNVPANVLIEKGCNFVIAVSVTATMEHEFARNRPETPIADMKPASTISTILRTHLVQCANLNALGVQPADIVIEPDVSGFELTAFTRATELAAIGEQTALQAVPSIRQALARMDGELFPAPEPPETRFEATARSRLSPTMAEG